MDKQETKEIPVNYLHEGWKAKTATLFGVSESLVNQVRLGVRTNTKILDYLLKMAELGKMEADIRIERLKALKEKAE